MRSRVAHLGSVVAAALHSDLAPARGHVLRGKALAKLASDGRVDTNFKVRTQFQGGATGPDGKSNASLLRQIRHEFLHNLLSSDYALCIRGAGNFSYRLYEALSVGRIPVFLDTDCVLPYDFIVDWKQYCIWINEKDLAFAGEIIANFHASFSPARFQELQHACRELWKTYLSPEGFFRNMHLHFNASDRKAQAPIGS